MPSTNTSAAIATDLGTLPASLVQDVNDTAGPSHEVWFSYTCESASEVVAGFWFYAGTSTNYQPLVDVYTGTPEALSLYLALASIDNKPFYIPVSNGTTYYFKVVNGGATDPLTSSLTVSGLSGPTDDITEGSIAINDDTPGFPAAFVNPSTGDVLQYVVMASGEAGNSLPGGTLLLEDTDSSTIRVYDASLTEIASIPYPSGFSSVGGITTNQSDTFYVGMKGVGATKDSIFTVDANGTVGTTWTMTTTGLSGLAVSPDGSIAYYGGAASIRRWDLSGNAAMSNLVALAFVPLKDVLCLGDGSVIVGKSTEGYRYSAAGSLLNTYTWEYPTKNRLASAIDNDAEFWVWSYVNSGADSRFQRVQASDGTATYTSAALPQFRSGVLEATSDDNSPRFGHSDSCPFWVQRAAIIVVPPGEVPPPIDPPPGPCCGSAGPGGSPTPTGYGGSGPQGPGESLPTPRKVPAGGPEPTYSPCATFGGVPATAADPSNAQDLTTCKTPLVHMKWILPDGSVRRYGQLAFTSGNGQSVAERVLKWGPVSQVLSDRHGSFQANQFTVTLSDYDRAIRTILSTASTQYIDGKEVEILIETAANAALSVNPLVLSRGIVTKWRYNRDLTVDLTVTDPLGYRWSSVSLDRPLPRRVVRVELFPNCPENTTGRAMPIIYGEMSDDYTWSVQPDRIPVGICPVIYVGPANTISAAGIPDSTWHAFLIAGHAIPCVSSIFGSNLDPDGEQPIRMSSDRIGVEFLIPGNGADHYYDITGTDGVTERCGLMFARGPVADAHIDGRVPITINPYGIEDVGDGTGDCITDIAYQFQHFLCYWVVQDYMTGSWGSVPAFTDGTAKVRTSSFAACRTVHNARVSEGYFGSMYMGDQKPARDWGKEFAVSGDMRPGVNNHGQILAITFNEQQSTTGLTTFTDQDHVLQASFEIDPEPDEIFNIYTYEYGPEPATGRVSGLARTVRSPASITNHGERVAQALLYRGIRRKATADDVANRTLVRSRDAPTTVTFTLDLRGAALSLGQLIRVTHYQGIGSTGWTERVLMVTRITVHPDADEFTTEIECEDMNDLLVAGGEVFTLDAGQVDLGRVA